MQLMNALNQPGGVRYLSNQLVKGGVVDFDMVLEVGTQISILTKSNGDAMIIHIVAQLITAFQKSFNIYAPMDDEQIADLAVDLVADFWAYKLEDFVAFFHAARKGLYGEIKNRIDEQTILMMLTKYDNQRTKRLEERQLELKSLEMPGGEQRKPDALSGKLDRLAGAIGEIRGGVINDNKMNAAHEKKHGITDVSKTIKPKPDGK